MEKKNNSNIEKKVYIKIFFEPVLLEKLRYLHKEEGPMNYKTKKRKPFSAFIRKVLSDHVRERITSIDVLSEKADWSEKDFA